MKILLDTHAFLWFVHGDERLSKTAERVINAPANTIYLSHVSLWEIAVKTSIGKLDLGRPFDDFVDQFVAGRNLALLPIEIRHLSRVASLPFHHRDPFDRLLVAQAESEQLAILTSDPQFKTYRPKVRW